LKYWTIDRLNWTCLHFIPFLQSSFLNRDSPLFKCTGSLYSGYNITLYNTLTFLIDRLLSTLKLNLVAEWIYSNRALDFSLVQLTGLKNCINISINSHHCLLRDYLRSAHHPSMTTRLVNHRFCMTTVPHN